MLTTENDALFHRCGDLYTVLSSSIDGEGGLFSTEERTSISLV